MRMMLIFDAVDDGTKHVVRILTGSLRDERWRLDSLEAYEVDDEDLKLSNLLILGCGREFTPKQGSTVPVSPLMEEFLNHLEEIGIEEKRCVAFGTRPPAALAGEGAASYIQDRLFDMGAKILLDGMSFDMENEATLSMATVKRVEEFAEHVKRAFVGDMINRYGEVAPFRGRISDGSDKEIRR